ncbi:Bardet-Biedl syndrome 10 protein homolog [Plakobranchus ocellatus]|uniref:Bardet-Biedl syndrome 10 protein homolog n=1 Tax=Plakobranchus ocellatus TaxID=259542 RepID=A0AAV3Y4N0_9GAST|nr:Bardet-Biedl syndrome 10 protein homolog [Plakobranchus ocellatus]
MADRDSGNPVVDINLTDLVKVTSTLKNLISRSFGPSCRPTLLTTNTGQVVLSKDGHTILSALSMAHPVAKCVVDAVFSHADVYGDGCKTLIIFLSELFYSIERNIDMLGLGNKGAALKSGLSLSLRKFVNEELTSVCDGLINYVKSDMFSCRVDSDHGKLYLRHLTRSILMGNFPEEVVNHMADLLTSLFVDLDQVGNVKNVFNLCFQNCVHIAPNKSYLSSFLDNGLCFHAVFSGQQAIGRQRAKLVLVTCPLGGQEHNGENEFFMQMKSDMVYEDILNCKNQIVERFLSAVKNWEVSLILISEKVPDFVVHACSIFNIDIVSCLDDEDIEFLCNYSGKSPITSVSHAICEANICEAESYEQILCSGKPMLKIVCKGKLSQWEARTLFLYAPSDGLSQQLKLLIRKCFKVVSSSYETQGNISSKKLESEDSRHFPHINSNRDVSLLNQKLFSDKSKDVKNEMHTCSPFGSLNFIGGGGFFEFLLAHLIEEHSKQICSIEKKIWAKVVVKMLHSVPQVLFSNLSPCRVNHAASFLSLCQEAKKSLQSHRIVGFNSKGILCDTYEAGIMDVLVIKMASLFATLDVAVQLLRIDSVVGATRNHSPESENSAS